MKDSTKRTLRTAYQWGASLLLVVPAVIGIVQANLPLGETVTSVLATVMGVVLTVTKIHNALEEKGLIPAWLKDTTDTEE